MYCDNRFKRETGLLCYRMRRNSPRAFYLAYRARGPESTIIPNNNNYNDMDVSRTVITTVWRRQQWMTTMKWIKLYYTQLCSAAAARIWTDQKYAVANAGREK